MTKPFWRLMPFFLAASVSMPAPAADTEPRRMVLEFVQMAFKDKEVRQAFQRYVGSTYIQHNPNAIDGPEAAIQFIEGLQQQFPNAAYEIKRVAADGDLVFVHAHAKLNANDPGMAIVDIFRVERGTIVEHWDVIQQVPSVSANPNTMF